jgi:hypothetical protein
MTTSDTAPRRIQRRRAKGWRLPEGAVIVDRSTPWGNPFVAGRDGTSVEVVDLYRYLLVGLVCASHGPSVDEQMAARRHVVAHLEEIRGRDLACWCRPGAPCHADVLLDLANRPRCEEVTP